MTITPDKPKRPDVEGIEVRAGIEWAKRGDWDGTVGVDRLVSKDIPALIAYIKALEARKWDVKHTDTMNDMVALGIDRDSWKARVEALEAAVDDLFRAAQLCVEGSGVEAGITPLRMRMLREAVSKHKALAALGDGDG